MTDRTEPRSAEEAAREWLHEHGWHDPSADEVELCGLMLGAFREREAALVEELEAAQEKIKYLLRRYDEAGINPTGGDMDQQGTPTHADTMNDLDKRFTYHRPKDGQPELYTAIRAKARELAVLVSDSQPTSRERSLSITAIEEAVMWANAGIARNT